MKVKLQRSKLIAKLNRVFPDCNAVPSEDFDGQRGGIWFRQEGEYAPDGLPLFDYWGECHAECVHPSLDKMLESAGWHTEPYDAGTYFAWGWK